MDTPREDGTYLGPDDEGGDAEIAHSRLIGLTQPHDSEETSPISADHQGASHYHLLVNASSTEAYQLLPFPGHDGREPQNLLCELLLSKEGMSSLVVPRVLGYGVLKMEPHLLSLVLNSSGTGSIGLAALSLARASAIAESCFSSFKISRADLLYCPCASDSLSSAVILAS